MNKEIVRYIAVLAAVSLFAGCTTDSIHDGVDAQHMADARELSGIQAVIVGGNNDGSTRSGTVTTLADYVGRSTFKDGDGIMFTKIQRTTGALEGFIYPNSNAFDGIQFSYANGGWSRIKGDGEPDRIYWTDATSNHTFIAYSIPENYISRYKKTTDETTNETTIVLNTVYNDGNTSKYDWKGYAAQTPKYYLGSLGDPTQAGTNDIIDYTLTAEEQLLDQVVKGETTVYYNHKLEREDLLIAYDTEMKAEPGGSVALVKFHHALSSVRVVVDISGFSSSPEAEDNKTVVSDMLLKNQPTMYVWQQANACAIPLRAESATTNDQPMVNTAWNNGDSNLPAYDQRKDIKLWIPRPAGTGSGQSRLFTFYGITTPQPSDYMTTLGDGSKYKNVELEFKVTYPDPLKPSTTVTKDYKATVANVLFRAGYNTTINISLNHQNEEMTVGAEYENWQFIATPDVGELKKNSTFLQDTKRWVDETATPKEPNITIVGDEKATMDDATWLYELNNTIYDIYGHDGSAAHPYQISTAYQLLSFAYEVKAGRKFTGKYIRLDADLTLQKSSAKTTAEIDPVDDADNYGNASAPLEWIGIGDGTDTNAFDGTFIGGNRFIYRLYGKPLFMSLGSNAKIEQLQVQAINILDTEHFSYSVDGGGLFADNNAGMICGSKVVGDISFSGTTAGAFVGTNTGTIFVSYHIGDTKGTATTGTPTTGGLVGINSGTIASCYHAGKVMGSTDTATGGIAGAGTGTYDNNYYNSTLLTSPTFTPTSGVTGKSSADMTKKTFVEVTTKVGDEDVLTGGINYGIIRWRTPERIAAGYDNYQYVYQPANYPKLEKKGGT